MSPRRSRVTLSGGAVVEVTRSGRARGRTALLLHGEDGPDSAAPTAQHLAVEHQVITPTHPGWAGTERGPGLDSVGALARAYLAVLAAADATDVVVVGISFGGWVAAQMAIADTSGRIGALVLIAPLGARVPGQAVRLPAATWVGSPAPRRAASASAATAPRDAAAVASSAALGAYAGRVAHDEALLARLEQITVPALVVCGDEDEVTSPAYARAWAGALGRGAFTLVPGGGHLPCHQAPGMTYGAIDAFLSAPLVLTRRGADATGSTTPGTAPAPGDARRPTRAPARDGR